MQPSTAPPHLYLVEVGDTIAIALIKPDFVGTAGATSIERVVEKITQPLYKDPPKWAEMKRSSGAPVAPGMSGVIAQTIALGGLALLGWVLVGTWLSILPGVAVAGAIGIYAYFRYGRLQKALEERWRAAHRVLAGPEKADFMKVFALADRVTTVWPEITRWVPVPYPGLDVAHVLWDVALKLEHRATIRPTRDKLIAARIALQSVDARVKQDVDDRLAEVDQQLMAVDRAIERRVAALRSTSEQCERFLRWQRAIEMGREAVHDADAMRGQFLPSTSHETTADDLRDQVRSIISAYRELTRDD